jgi:hypothetical protein
MKHVLYADPGEKYVIEHEYELAYLRWSGGTYPLGEHYGDPMCAVMNTPDGWCVTGGQGLVITIFEDGLPEGGTQVAPQHVRQTELWRPPPSGDVWYVFGVWYAGDDRVQAAVDPGSDHAGLYEVNVRTLAWHKV